MLIFCKYLVLISSDNHISGVHSQQACNRYFSLHILDITVSISISNMASYVSLYKPFSLDILWLLEQPVCKLDRPEVPGSQCLQEQLSANDSRGWGINTLGSLLLRLGNSEVRSVDSQRSSVELSPWFPQE